MIENVTKVPQYTSQSGKIDPWPEYNKILSEIFGKIVQQTYQLKRWQKCPMKKGLQS